MTHIDEHLSVNKKSSTREESKVFLLKELIKRDFKKRYRSSLLGVLWSVFEPLLRYCVLRLVFTQLLGRDTPHYSTFLFAGIIVFTFFSDATTQGMSVFVQNKKIIEKVKLPKYLFVVSKITASFINFLLILVVFFFLASFDGIHFGWKILSLIFPIIFIYVFCLGIALLLSVLYVYFRDLYHLYGVIVLLLRYASAIFYRDNQVPEKLQAFIQYNPIYLFILYFREVVIQQKIPSIGLHLNIVLWSIFMLGIGILVYFKKSDEIIYNF